MKKAITKLLVGSLAIAMSSIAISEESTEATLTSELATVVVLRGEENRKTSGLKFDVYVGEKRMGRFGTTDSATQTFSPGSYMVSSNFKRDKSKAIDLQQGKTYYLKAVMTKRGGAYQTSYELVTEDYAFNEIPGLQQKL